MRNSVYVKLLVLFVIGLGLACLIGGIGIGVDWFKSREMALVQQSHQLVLTLAESMMLEEQFIARHGMPRLKLKRLEKTDAALPSWTEKSGDWPIQQLSPQIEGINTDVEDQMGHTQEIHTAIASLSDELQETRAALHETYVAIAQLNPIW